MNLVFENVFFCFDSFAKILKQWYLLAQSYFNLMILDGRHETLKHKVPTLDQHTFFSTYLLFLLRFPASLWPLVISAKA